VTWRGPILPAGHERKGRLYDPSVSVEGSRSDAARLPVAGDSVSRRWVGQLRPGHPCQQNTVIRLHQLLRRAARHELIRRRTLLPVLAGRELDDVAEQCADDALVGILAKLDDFQGLSRFTTWAYKFAIFEVSRKVAQHAWQRQPPSRDELELAELPDRLAPGPDDHAERREQLAALKRAIECDLTPRQRQVFVAVALNDVAIDVLALELESNRNAIYKNLFDARRALRASLAPAGYPVADDDLRG
jgi:RNA polymerase sigma-70 factor (ECF subfamily)